MKLFMKCGIAAVLVLAMFQSQAQYPSKPIRLVVHFAAGDALDSSARVLSDLLIPVMGQQVLVDNRPGAAGAIAAEGVAKSSADGYTLLYGTTAMMTITPYVRKLAYDPSQFDTVDCVSALTVVVAVDKDFPATNWADFVAAARKNPGKFSYATAGEGTLLHLVRESLQSTVGIKLLHVPYKGMAPALTDFLAGRINVFFEPVVIGHLQAGRGRAVAVIGDNRLIELPDTPTLAELGVPFKAKAWFGVFAPRGTPREAVDRLSAAIRTVTATNDFRAKLPPAIFPAFLSAEQFAHSIDEDRAMYRAVI